MVYMKHLLRLSVVFGLALIIQGCAVYPYGHSAYSGYGPYYGYQPYGYQAYGYQPYGSFGWGGGRHWGGGYNRGFGGGGHHGWGGGRGRR